MYGDDDECEDGEREREWGICRGRETHPVKDRKVLRSLAAENVQRSLHDVVVDTGCMIEGNRQQRLRENRREGEKTYA